MSLGYLRIVEFWFFKEIQNSARADTLGNYKSWRLSESYPRGARFCKILAPLGVCKSWRLSETENPGAARKYPRANQIALNSQFWVFWTDVRGTMHAAQYGSRARAVIAHIYINVFYVSISGNLQRRTYSRPCLPYSSLIPWYTGRADTLCISWYTRRFDTLSDISAAT